MPEVGTGRGVTDSGRHVVDTHGGSAWLGSPKPALGGGLWRKLSAGGQPGGGVVAPLGEATGQGWVRLKPLRSRSLCELGLSGPSRSRDKATEQRIFVS